MLFHQNKALVGSYCVINFKSLVFPHKPGKCSFVFCCIICMIKTSLKNELLHSISQLKNRKLCWVYPYLNVTLPFSIASLCVGDRVCTCISACQCVPRWVFVCECVFLRGRGRFYESEALCINVCFVCGLAGLRTGVGAWHFKNRCQRPLVV